MLGRFGAMSGQRRHLLIGAWLTLPAIDLSLRCLGLARTQRLLARTSSFGRESGDVPQPDAETLAAAEDRAAVIALAGRYALINGTCLRQSLLLWWLLRRQGNAPVIRIGVSKRAGFRAHAWVELHGRPLGQKSEYRAEFVRLAQWEMGPVSRECAWPAIAAAGTRKRDRPSAGRC